MDFPRPARQLTPEEEKGHNELPTTVSLRRDGSVKVYLFEPKKSDSLTDAANNEVLSPTLFMDSDREMEEVIGKYGNEIPIDSFRKMAGTMSRQKLAPNGLEYEIYRVKQIS